MDLDDLHKVWEVKALKNRPGEDEARRMLERIAKQVQPIMRSRKWKVKLLSEFCPSNPALLGLNVGGGTAVRLRLRRSRADWDFLPYEQVLDTMLHELCHIEHGPHNASFYRLWDEIRKECEDLISRGVSGTGKGFDLPGRRLGGFSHQPPLSALRQTALAAAQKRQRIGSLLPSGPNRLGGDTDIMTALSPIQAAAMAAERRMHDDLWCGSISILDDSHISENLEHCGSGTSSTSSTICGKRSIDAISKNNAQSLGGSFEERNDAMSSASDPPMTSVSSSANLSHGAPNHGSFANGYVQDTPDGANWECGICTLINKPLSLVCEACGIQRPKVVTSKFKVWACKFCTLDNSTELDKCLACGQWRYSNGAPVSVRGPNLDT